MKSYVHTIPGRLRLRSERLKADLAATTELQSTLRGLGGVSAVEFHPRSSSLLVYYDPSTDTAQEMLFIFRERGYLDDGFSTNLQPASAIVPLTGKGGKRRNLGTVLVNNVKQVAVSSVAGYLLEAAIIRFAPPAAIPLMLLPLIRRSRPHGVA